MFTGLRDFIYSLSIGVIVQPEHISRIGFAVVVYLSLVAILLNVGLVVVVPLFLCGLVHHFCFFRALQLEII